jgi:hypothetical protein
LHTSFNHAEFAQEMKQCKHAWLITYDDSPEIRKNFVYANIYEWQLQSQEEIASRRALAMTLHRIKSKGRPFWRSPLIPLLSHPQWCRKSPSTGRSCRRPARWQSDRG